MRKTILFSFFVLFCLCLSCVARAENVCFKCHTKAHFEKKNVHQPLRDGKCGACHNPHVAKYKGLLQQQGAQLCFACHTAAAKDFAKGVVHAPVRKGECLACHDAHSSNSSALMRKDLAATCLECHKALAEKNKYSHAPFAKGQCLACHRPHQAANQLLLTENSDKLCLGCHQEATLAKGHQGFPSTPQKCLSCHNPHGSNRKALVRNILHEPFAKGCDDCHGKGDAIDSVDICLKCHQNIKEKLYTTHNHLTSAGGNGCLSCHSPHAGDRKDLLKAGQQQICRSCHEETYRRKEASSFQHPDSTSCSNCHDVHGSNDLAMVRGNGNSVCAKCHKSQGQFTHPVGEKVLDPRNGQMVTCVSCHYPMGTEFKFQLKQNGSKELCVPCHRTY